MKIRRMRNNVKITDIIRTGGPVGRCFGFGIILDGAAQPNFVFIPQHVIDTYQLTPQSVGEIVDCVFRDDERRQGKQDPVMMMIFEDTDPANPTLLLDEFDAEESSPLKP